MTPTTLAGARRGRSLRRRGALHNHSLHFGPNMTPMVDVVLVILIFFMTSAAFMGSEWFLKAAIPLPAGSRQDGRDPFETKVRFPIVIETAADGRTVVSFRELKQGTIEQFAAELDKLPKGRDAALVEVLMKPAPQVPYADVIRVHEALETAGITAVGIGPGPGAK